MSWLNKAVRSGVDRAIKQVAAPGGLLEVRIRQLTTEHLALVAAENRLLSADLTPLRFVWQMAFELMRVGRLNAFDARDRAEECLRVFLKDEKISFGDPAFAWDQGAAITLAHDLEIEHWESAA